MYHYSQFRKRTYEEPKVFDVAKGSAAALLSIARKENRKNLNPVEMHRLLEAYGIPSAPVELVQNETHAAQEATRLGFPVVLKAFFKSKLHKTDLGGVILDLRNESEVSNAFRSMKKRIHEQNLESDCQGIYVQPMIRGGKEVILGVSYDVTFGPLLMFGLGGIFVESMKDTIFRSVPINETDARTMIESIKAYSILRGIRGEAPVDIPFLAEMLQRLSQLVSDFHFIREIEINPFFASADRTSSLALDARIVLDWTLEY
jgi:acyl-CoA synthetase (NDP forming)